MLYYMHDITWPEFQAKKDSVVILPIGATEQHAQHLPLCTDAKIAEKFSYYLAKELDGIIMPTLCYGYKSKPLSGGGPLFPGTIDLNGKTVIDLVYDVLMELVRDGFTKIFIMNAHFENEAREDVSVVLCEVDRHSLPCGVFGGRIVGNGEGKKGKQITQGN